MRARRRWLSGRWQIAGLKGTTNDYKGTVDVLRRVYAADGVRGLWRGLIPNYLKIVPASGITFVVFEYTRRLLVA